MLLLRRGFKSEKGTYLSETSPSRTSLAAESAVELPLYVARDPDENIFPSQIKSKYSSLIKNNNNNNKNSNNKPATTS